MKMLPFGMQRLFLRSRRKTLLLVTFGTFLVVGSVLFSGSVRNPYAIELGSDYDLNEDASAIDGVHAMVRHMGIVKRKVAAAAGRVNNKPNIWSTDRKPQAAPDEEMYDYNSATNNVPADAMKYTFLNHQIKMADTSQLVNETSKLESDMYADEKDEIEDTDPDDDTDQEYEDYPENPIFKPGDFDDVSNITRIPFRFQELSSKDKDVEYDSNLYPKPKVDSVPAVREQSNHLRNSRVLHSQSWSEKTGGEDNLCPDCNPSVVTRINTQKTGKKRGRSSVRSVYKHNRQVNSTRILLKQVQTHAGDGESFGYDPPATQLQTPVVGGSPAGEVRSRAGGYLLVTDRIYWSPQVERLVPKGLSASDVSYFMQKTSTTRVREMHAPQWNRCGRPNNQYLVLQDGTPLCARYRDPHNKLITGELLSFYLARLLGLDNVPAVVLSQLNASAPQWQGHDLSKANWQQGKMVALMQWIQGLESERSRVRMPAVILWAYEKGLRVDGGHTALPTMTQEELSDLVQWSDMLLFDYITGHYDRVASMQDGADRENRPSIMTESIRNLRKASHSGKYWLIDNESGLFDAYELLYYGKEMGKKFVQFHSKMLRTMCLFRKSVAEKIEELSKTPWPEKTLVQFVRRNEPLYDKMPHIPEFQLFTKYFHTRLKEVSSWIRQCRHR